jgi:ATP-binding cassette subfamily B protein/subfamily B ATP-binding cassette protein MsbA
LIRQTAKKEWKLISITFFCSLLQAAAEGLTLGVMFLAVQVLSTPTAGTLSISKLPYLNAIPKLADIFHGITTFQAFTWLLSIAVILKLIQGFAMYLGSIATGYFANRVSRQLKSQLHRQILNYSFSCASRYRIGELQYVNGSGPQAVISEINTYSSLTTTILLMVTYLTVLLRLSPWLLVAAFLLGGTSTLIQRVLLPKVGENAKETTEISKSLSSRMTENIQGLRLLHTSGFLEEAAQEVERQTYKLEQTARRQVRLLSVNGPITMVLPIIMITIIAWLSILIFGQKSTGILPSLVTFVIALQRLNSTIGTFSDILLRKKSNAVLLALLNKFLNPQDKEFRPRDGLPFQHLCHEIRLQDVDLYYVPGQSPSLEAINIVIPHGHTIALVGSSGAGKSSIADLLAGLYQPTHGEITIDGTDLRGIDLTSWQKRIGVVSQDTFLFNASIADNISFGTPGASMKAIQSAAQQAQAAGFIDKLPEGYDTLVGERGYRLSGGQRQRISLARAILRDPDLLILDEATSALDTESERLVQEAIDRFERKHTILVIAHRLSTIVGADRIYVLDQGRVIEQGNHNQLLQLGGRYARLWRQQVKAGKHDTVSIES